MSLVYVWIDWGLFAGNNSKMDVENNCRLHVRINLPPNNTSAE